MTLHRPGGARSCLDVQLAVHPCTALRLAVRGPWPYSMIERSSGMFPTILRGFVGPLVLLEVALKVFHSIKTR